MGIINLTLILLNVLDVLPAFWMISILVYYAISHFNSKKISGSFKDSEKITQQVARYSSVFDFVESYNYSKAPNLKLFVSKINDSKSKPSILFNKMKLYLEILTMRANPFLWVMIGFIFPLDFYLGYKIETCKQRISEHYDDWLSTWYGLEALSSLANFSALNPRYIFPDIKKDITNTHKVLSACKLGHPLLREEGKVRNDFSIDALHNVYLFTGSNMSGKSTFLRSVGMNILLAYSGGPVDSNSFSVHLIKMFTCINVADSVVDGISYFYAEVKRLKILIEILEEENAMPVLFLIDEIFRGTNNIERLKGSQAYIRKLLNENTSGLIATHDLELTKLEDENERVKNFHFREDIENGKMKFNYKLFNGPCPTTNALKIMEMEGLPVENQGET